MGKNAREKWTANQHARFETTLGQPRSGDTYSRGWQPPGLDAKKSSSPRGATQRTAARLRRPFRALDHCCSQTRGLTPPATRFRPFGAPMAHSHTILLARDFPGGRFASVCFAAQSQTLLAGLPARCCSPANKSGKQQRTLLLGTYRSRIAGERGDPDEHGHLQQRERSGVEVQPAAGAEGEMVRRSIR